MLVKDLINDSCLKFYDVLNNNNSKFNELIIDPLKKKIIDEILPYILLLLVLFIILFIILIYILYILIINKNK